MKKVFLSLGLLLIVSMAIVMFNSCNVLQAVSETSSRTSGNSSVDPFSRVEMTTPKSIDVKILQCEPEGEQIVMTLLLTNRGESISYYGLALNSNAGNAIDNLGNEYKISCAFGQKTSGAATSLSTDVPIKLYIKIGNSSRPVNSKATHFALVEAIAYNKDKFAFKNVPILR